MSTSGKFYSELKYTLKPVDFTEMSKMVSIRFYQKETDFQDFEENSRLFLSELCDKTITDTPGAVCA